MGNLALFVYNKLVKWAREAVDLPSFHNSNYVRTLGHMTQYGNRGFTIVELLIVIVVIGVLAGIVIVAYGGVTNKANGAAAKSNATAIKKVAETYSIDPSGGSGSYPASVAALTGYTGISKVPSGVTVNATTPTGLLTGDKEGTHIQYLAKSGNSGGCIGYWDSSLTTPAVAYLYAGNASSVAAGPTCN